MKKININLQTIFLGIMAVMLTTLVIMIGSGFILARNKVLLPQEVEFVEEVISEGDDTVFIIED